MTIREKINYLEAVEEMVKRAEYEMRDYMDCEYNEEKQDYVYSKPIDDYKVSRYLAWEKLVNDIMKLAEKV